MPDDQNQSLWTEVDRYFSDLWIPHDVALDAAVAANRQAGLPAIDVSPIQGKFLHLLARISGARRILEIGMLGGYSTIWLARALPPDGRAVSLELSEKHAQVARENLRRAGLLSRVDIRVGPALDTLSLMIKAGEKPFDFIFIDADKSSYPEYLQWALRLSRPGTVIVADNVIRDGEVIRSGSTDADVKGVRRFNEIVAAEPRLSATALQSVGVKGYDGMAVALVLS